MNTNEWSMTVYRVGKLHVIEGMEYRTLKPLAFANVTWFPNEAAAKVAAAHLNSKLDTHHIALAAEGKPCIRSVNMEKMKWRK